MSIQHSQFRVGIGYDLHRLVEGRPLILGGVAVPSERGLLGHSDADVVLHATCDALLGAAGLGDIGEHFPDTDSAYKDSDSQELLRRVVELVHDRGLRVVNVDIIIHAQQPKLSDFKPAIRTNLAKLLELSPDSVGVKATTNEGLGEIGRAEAIACWAAVLVTKSDG